jgi:hypothetical protein
VFYILLKKINEDSTMLKGTEEESIEPWILLCFPFGHFLQWWRNWYPLIIGYQNWMSPYTQRYIAGSAKFSM